MRDRRVRRDPVAKVEDVRTSAHCGENASTPASRAFPPATTRSGSRFPCNAVGALTSSRAKRIGVIQSTATASTPVPAAKPPIRAPAPRGKAITGTAGTTTRTRSTSALMGRTHHRSKPSSSRISCPAVEDLQHIHTGSCLRNEIAGRHLHQHVDQRLQPFRVCQCETPRRKLLVPATAGNHVCRNSPWRPAKAYQRPFAIKVTPHPTHRFEDRRQPFFETMWIERFEWRCATGATRWLTVPARSR